MTYSLIAIIYNPNSTGPSESMAKEFAKSLRKKLSDQNIEVVATKRAGHAEELAEEIARREKHALIVSSSGDGGYNEVVNGAMKAQKDGQVVTTALLPAGNANDHFNNLTTGDLVELVVKDDVQNIDLLKIVGTANGKAIQRYAHSYAGVGLSPQVGLELNKTKLNRLKELWLVAKTLLTVRPVRLVIDGKSRRYDSIIFSNVDTMSKYLKVSQPASITDGKFEVSVSRRRSKWQLLTILFRASTVGVEEDLVASEYTFRTVIKTIAQLDGEIIEVDADTDVTVTAEKQILRCIV